MNEEYKKKLYEHFLKDTPIKYESITPMQWDDMSRTLAGFSIQLTTSLSQVWDGISKAVEPIVEALNKAINK